jgi:hypothetical protein
LANCRQCGDFDGDGRSDILWQHTGSGQLYIWLMNGTGAKASGSPGTVADLNWKISGVCDFNSDGRSDILWQHLVSGEIYIWQMNGTTVASHASPEIVK